MIYSECTLLVSYVVCLLRDRYGEENLPSIGLRVSDLKSGKMNLINVIFAEMRFLIALLVTGTVDD